MDSEQQPPAESKTRALRSRNFRLYQAARFGVIVGAEAQSVAVAWQVYQLTGSALDLGYTGLALFLPGVFFMLAAGHVADRYDRRHIIQLCYVVQMLASLLLLEFALHGTGRAGRIWPVYAVLFLIGTSRCFSGPASSALVPMLVPKEDFVNAVTWGATVFQTANALGPALGGLLFTAVLPLGQAHWHGAPVVYVFTLLSLVWFLVLISMMDVDGRVQQKGLGSKTVLAGLQYVMTQRMLLGSLSLDLFAVLLGGAVALMPIFAHEVLHAGPQGLGLLRAMPSAGALLVSAALLYWPIKRHAGHLMFACVGIFGLATVVFGLTTNITVALIALFILGASDMVSVVVRSSILQLATPPEMRGRVSAVNWLFIGASNEFGEFESGVTAHWWGAVRAVVVGGVASMVVTGLWTVLFPQLRRADRLEAESLRALEVSMASAEPID